MRIYSIVVFGFDSDKEYFHDCDFIKAKDITDAFQQAVYSRWKKLQYYKYRYCKIGRT